MATCITDMTTNVAHYRSVFAKVPQEPHPVSAVLEIFAADETVAEKKRIDDREWRKLKPFVKFLRAQLSASKAKVAHRTVPSKRGSSILRTLSFILEGRMCGGHLRKYSPQQSFDIFATKKPRMKLR